MNYQKSYTKLIIDFFKYTWKGGPLSLHFRIIMAMFFLSLSKISLVFVPIIFKKILDNLILEDPVIFVSLGLIIAYGMMRIMSQVFNELKEIIFVRVAQFSVKKLAIKTFSHLYELSLSYHIDRKTGALSNAIQRGVKAIERLLTFAVFFILPIFFEILFICITLSLYYKIYYLAIIIVTLSIYILYTITISNWRSSFIYKMNDADNASMAKVVDSLLNYETVKYFTNENYEISCLDKLMSNYEELAIKNKHTLLILNLGQNIIISLGLLALMMLAGYQILSHGSLTMGDFVLLNTYLLQLYQPLNNLGFAYREMKTALIDIAYIFEILEQKPKIQDKQNARVLDTVQTTIAFENVDFSYHKDRTILNGVTFNIPSNQTIAIVGPSGAGKSTISKLIYRFYDIDSGKISINGVNIKDIQQNFLRKIIGIVPQDTILFNNSIYYNILYGNFSATKEEVMQAAKRAQVHDFIMSLPQQYETIVGERGIKLSGGEKQRVAIARLLLKNPSILIFDEATSALDTKTEKMIQHTLKQISKDKTTLIIAHRLSTIVDADNIIVLENGTIVESGTHEELLKLNKVYADMWYQQKKKNV